MSTWPAVALAPGRISLGPGDDATVTVAITNTGDVVEHYGVQILGLPPGQLSEVEPPVTKLQPGESGQVTARIGLSQQVPPDAATLVLGVLVRSPYRPDVSRAEELRLEVQPAPGLSATAEPEVVHGARGQYRITLRNDGNTALDVVLTGSDPESAVRLTFTPQRITLTPGTTAVSDLTASANRPLTGRELQRRIAVVAQAGTQQATADLTLVQRPRIASTAMRVSAALGGLLVAVGTMFGATLLVTNAIAGQGGNTQNTAAGTDPGAGTAGQASAPAVVVTPSITPSAGPSAGPSTPSVLATTPAGEPTPVQAGTPLDLNLTVPPADGRTGPHVIDADAYPGVVLASEPAEQASQGCQDETRVQYVISPQGQGFVSSGSSVVNASGGRDGLCMDMPVLISFAQPVTKVSVTVLPLLTRSGAGKTPAYGILATELVSGTPTTVPRTVAGAEGQPIQLTWEEPGGLTQVKVGSYPSYEFVVTAIQRITAS